MDTLSLEPGESRNLKELFAASRTGHSGKYRALEVQAKYKENEKAKAAKENALNLLQKAQVWTNFNTGSFIICC